MKKTTFVVICLISAVFITSSCKKAVNPTLPEATRTPNATQTIEAFISAVGAANATNTAVAAITMTHAASLYSPTCTPTKMDTPDLTATVRAIVTMVGNAYATETALAGGIQTAVVLSYTRTSTATPTSTMTSTGTSTLTGTCTGSRTASPTFTATCTITITRTSTPTSTVTCTYTITNTFTITLTYTISPTPIMTTPPLELINCSSDSIVSYCPVSAVVAVNDSQSIVPLCNGWIIYGDCVRNSVIVRNIITWQTAFEIQLNAKPERMAYDRSTGILYVTLTGSTSIAKADLLSRSVHYLPVGGIYNYITLGDNQTVFLSSYYSNQAPNRVLVVDGSTGNTITSTGNYYDGGEIAFDRISSNLFIGVTGLSPATLYKYAYDPLLKTLSQVENSRDLGSNAQDLMLSPDCAHLLFSTGGGNGGAYSLYDVSTAGLTTSFGSWPVGAYPTSAAFSPSGQQIVASNSSNVMLFDAINHTLIKTLPDNAASIGDFRFTRFSGGGRIVYALYRDDYYGNYSIHWWVN